MTFCRECSTRRAAVSIAESEFGTRVRRYLRTNKASDLREMDKAKGQREKARDALRVHTEACEL